MKYLFVFLMSVLYAISGHAFTNMDSSHVTEINDETLWQTTLAGYRGKVVVAWIFPGHFEKKYTVKHLNELKKAQERYKGKNVVFLACIRQKKKEEKTVTVELFTWEKLDYVDQVKAAFGL